MSGRHGTLESRFWAKVQRGNDAECWPWIAAKKRDGYGHIRAGGRGTPMLSAHRVAYELCIGPVPPNLLICHRCDTPACCNPAHMFLGTDADNHADKVAKGRQAKGDKAGRVVVPDAALPGVFADFKSGVPPKRIAERLGASVSTVYMILRGKRRSAEAVNG